MSAKHLEPILARCATELLRVCRTNEPPLQFILVLVDGDGNVARAANMSPTNSKGLLRFVATDDSGEEKFWRPEEPS